MESHGNVGGRRNEGNNDMVDSSDHTTRDFATHHVAHSSIPVRKPFTSFINKIIQQVEAKFSVTMSLNQNGDEHRLTASGSNARASINYMLNLCRKSRIYNFYMCFPIRGDCFNHNFQAFKARVTKRIGTNVKFEQRPHITLALFSLPTDSDIYLVIRNLQMSTMKIRAMNLEPIPNVELKGLKTVLYRGKNAKMSVLMSLVSLPDVVADVADEFQSSGDKAMKSILEMKLDAADEVGKDDVTTMTQDEAAALGIFINNSGNVEITYTDVTAKDPNCSMGDKEFEAAIGGLGSAHHETHRANGGQTSAIAEQSAIIGHADPNVDHHADPNIDQSVNIDHADHSADHSEAHASDVPDQDHPTTAVRKELHVTLLRDLKVQSLLDLPFTCQSPITCVELRPRLSEVCSFSVYTKDELITYVGNRYDNIANPYGTSQITLPAESQTDVHDKNVDNSKERFVFWLQATQPREQPN